MTSNWDGTRWAWADIDLDAIAHNVAAVRQLVAPSRVWAVVKANAYGHGAVDVAQTALAAGAEGLCVALVQEGVSLRRAGISSPILVLSEQPVDQIGQMIDADLTPTVYTAEYIRAWGDALVACETTPQPVGVHLKIDTGMQRVGAPTTSLKQVADALATALDASSGKLTFEGVFTHLACADAPDQSSNGQQLADFDAAVSYLRDRGLDASVVHAANSAAALALPNARRSLVRLGIAMYGISPGSGVDPAVAALPTGLRPALSLRARVSLVKHVDADTAVSYGLRRRFDRPTTLATVPIGYADGVSRRLGTRPDAPDFEVLIHGRRCPIVGVVTMDQLMVDVGDMNVAVGDEVVLIGSDGSDRISAEDWADHLGTIGYEVVCGIGPRVPRRSSGGSSGRTSGRVHDGGDSERG